LSRVNVTLRSEATRRAQTTQLFDSWVWILRVASLRGMTERVATETTGPQGTYLLCCRRNLEGRI